MMAQCAAGMVVLPCKYSCWCTSSTGCTLQAILLEGRRVSSIGALQQGSITGSP